MSNDAISFYVDENREYAQKNGKPVLWCHFWTTGSDDDLDRFARRLGLQKRWAHLSGGISGRFYHYDLRGTRRERAIQWGAQEIRLRDWIASRPEFIQFQAEHHFTMGEPIREGETA